MKRIFKFVVEGQYYGVGDASGVSVLKPYKEEFLLTSTEAALSTIVKFLLDAKLKTKYTGYRAYRTHRIVRSEIVEGKAPDNTVLNKDIEGMSLAQLADFCILRGLEVDPFKCTEKTTKAGGETVKLTQLEVARDRVMKEWENKRARSKQEDVDREERAEEVDLLKLNGLEDFQAQPKMVLNVPVAAHTPGAAMVQPVVGAVEPAEPGVDGLLPGEEPGSDTIE